VKTPSLDIARLALPAVVILAAEPLYVLVDTAVVGHLGSAALAALAVGGGVLTLVAWLGTVLAYGTTGRSARRFGAGDRPAAVREGIQASWLALIAGVIVAVAAQFAARPLAALLAGDDPGVVDAAAQWMRVAALGAPGLMLATAGNGWLRGVQDTRRPLSYVVGAFALSAVLCPVLVYPLGFGLVGSAIANVVAQTTAGALFVRALVRERVTLRPDVAVMGAQLVVARDLMLRGLAFQACFLSATAVVARFGVVPLAAHQIALQLWLFCALLMDAVAIAAQSLIGAELGAGRDRSARDLAKRIAVIGGVTGAFLAVCIGAGAWSIPAWFSSDPQVHAQALVVWPWFAAMQPLAGVVFALDGVLIGAGDVRYMRNLTLVAAVGGLLPAIWMSHWLNWGLSGVWAGLSLSIVIRLVALLLRLRTGRWATVGVH